MLFIGLLCCLVISLLSVIEDVRDSVLNWQSSELRTILNGKIFVINAFFLLANDLLTLYDRVRDIAKRCKKLNMERKKFAVGTELSFAGLKPCRSGENSIIDKVSSAFLGLANQLSGFVPDLAHMTVKLRELTAKKNAFLWLEDHQKRFERVKLLMTSDMVVTHFDSSLHVAVLTDAS